MNSATETGPRRRAALVRGAGYAGFWIVLVRDPGVADLVAGLFAALGATWLSLRLLPPSAGRVRLAALFLYAPRFLWQSLRGGVDVAWRAFLPSMPLQPDILSCRTAFPPGPARNGFAAIASLLPGSLMAGDTADAYVLHCLDAGQPVAQQIAAEESVLAGALLPGKGHV